MDRRFSTSSIGLMLLRHMALFLHIHLPRAVFVRFSLGGGSEFRLAVTDRATIAGMEVAKLVPWNGLLNYYTTSVSIEAKAPYSCT